MTIFVTSDHHFWHKNIITFSPRPFKSVSHMNTMMVQYWNTTVMPKDSVIHLGDFALKNLRDIKHMRSCLSGKIYLILGNHDKKKSDMERAGFEVLPNPLKYENILIFSHEPLNHVPKGFVNVHGHIHDQHKKGMYINVCVEHTNYRPVPIKNYIKRAKEMIRIGVY